jgi:signal transduction histidine kinase
MEKILTPRFIFISVAVVLAALSRLLPHLPNFTPIAAIALMGGAFYSDKRLAFLVPMLAMVLSDLFLPVHNTIWSVYLSFALIVCIGFTLKNNLKVHSLLIASLTSSVLFFIITNFAVWFGSTFYSQDFAGLLFCYEQALPFFSNTVMGDVFYTTVLFGAFYLLNIQFPKLQLIPLKK